MVLRLGWPDVMIGNRKTRPNNRKLSCGVIMKNKRDELCLVIQRDGFISFPKGKFESDKDDSFRDTAIRELREETGYCLSKNDLIGAKEWKSSDTGYIYYFLTIDEKELEQVDRNNDCEIERVIWVHINDFPIETYLHGENLKVNADVKGISSCKVFTTYKNLISR